MIQFILLPLLASPFAQAAGGDWKNGLKPTGVVEEDTIKPCYYWVNDAEKEDCDELKKELKITQRELTIWVSFFHSLSLAFSNANNGGICTPYRILRWEKTAAA